MPTGIIITSTTNTVSLEFVGLSSVVTIEQGTWMKHELSNVKLTVGQTYVSVIIRNETEFYMSIDGSKGLPVISINGLPVACNLDIYNKIRDIL